MSDPIKGLAEAESALAEHTENREAAVAEANVAPEPSAGERTPSVAEPEPEPEPEPVAKTTTKKK